MSKEMILQKQSQAADILKEKNIDMILETDHDAVEKDINVVKKMRDLE